MTATELAKYPWAENNIPPSWDFQNKTDADLAPLCFGVFFQVETPVDGWQRAHPGRCKIIYGGQDRARTALVELEKVGLRGELVQPKRDATFREWAWSVYVEGISGL